MIRELRLQNFRAFRELSLARLGRVNLLVGTNNSGKTSVLEAVAFLASGGDPRQLYRSLLWREEQAVGEGPASAASDDAVDVRHLFFGRNIGDDAELGIGGVFADGAAVELRLSTPRVSDQNLPKWREAIATTSRLQGRRDEIRAFDVDRAERAPRSLHIRSNGVLESVLPLLPNGGLSEMIAALGEFTPKRSVSFIVTSGLDNLVLSELFDRIVLTSEEGVVVAALREVEGGITRLATRQLSQRKRGFVVGMEGAGEPVPLGSLGDGVHRLLAIALSLVNARGGYLLVDEIDTGLHHTVMQKMWRLVFETAKRLDVTVFATTHSYDCVHALAAIARPDIREGGEVSLIRIERDRPLGVHFTEAEISHLAEWQIEAR